MRFPSLPVQTIRNDYSSTNVTTSAYVQLTASTLAECLTAEIVDTSTQDFVLAVGPAGGEVDFYRIPASQNKLVPFHLSKGERLAIKAVSGTASSGTLIINLFG